MAACACAVEHDAHVMELLLAVEPLDVGQLAPVEHPFADDVDAEVGQAVADHGVGHRHGGRAVQEEKVVTLLELPDQPVEPLREEHFGRVGRLRSGVDHVQPVVYARGADECVGVVDRSGQIGRQPVLAAPVPELRREGVAPEVEVHEQHPLPGHGQRGGEVHRHEGLSGVGIRRGEEHAADSVPGRYVHEGHV